MNFDIIDLPSENMSERGEAQISLIIAHCIGLDFMGSLRTLTKSSAAGGGGVSAHYFIPQISGQEIVKCHADMLPSLEFRYPEQVPVFRLVREKNQAWHAGASSWQYFNEQPGRAQNLNASTIGIEFHSPGYAKGDGSDLYFFENFSDEQIKTGCALIKEICQRWSLPLTRVLAHSDIAPLRKTDPGAYFPWEFLAAQGLGLWWESAETLPPLAGINRVSYVQERLNSLGYDCPQSDVLDEHTQKVITAFRLHFMQDSWRIDDKSDAVALNGVIDDALLLKLAGIKE